MKNYVVVLSGGQDSVTCLGVALREAEEAGSKVFAIGFRYGQTHEVELKQAAAICNIYNVPFEVHEIPSLAILGDSALTTKGNVNAHHHRNASLPASFVPNRNALFLTIAHAYAQKVEAEYVVTGVCQTDYSGYPDCRAEFIFKLQDALNVGYKTSIKLVTPLMFLTKSETFALAGSVGFLNAVLEHSHTCYNGDRTIRHSWGYGCGKCPACELRAKGYEEFVASERAALGSFE